MTELVVAAVLTEGRTKSEVARQYGVSRRWVITLVQRYLAEGDAGQRPRSRRPATSPGRTPVGVEDEIVRIRKELDRDGHEAGAATIAYHLAQRRGSCPAISTTWRILTTAASSHPNRTSGPRPAASASPPNNPGERWQLDITHWTLADASTAEILNIIDDHSRLCLDGRTRRTFKGHDVDWRFRRTTDAYGNPASMLSSGAVFTGAPRRQGRVALEVTLASRGIRFDHSRPYHPQTCGKIERFHQALKKWHARQPTASSLRQLQRQLDTFRAYYNDVRPHRALHRRTPATAYTARPKAHPAGMPIDTGHWRTRHDRVDASGVFTLRHNSRLHHIGVGRRHAETPILVLIHDLDIKVLTANGELLRELRLDPTKDYQPQPKT